MLFSIKIPVTEKQFQLLNAVIGPPPFNAKQKNYFGRIILSNFRDHTIKQWRHNYQGLYYEVNVPHLWVEKYGVCFVSDKSVDDFLEHVEKEFRYRMFSYIDGVLEFKERYNLATNNSNKKIVAKMKETALEYLYKNGLTEDFMTFDSMKKSYQRYLKHAKRITTQHV